MDKLIARANIDHYLSVLKSTELGSQDRATIVKLLVAEEDLLAHDMEQLQFAEDRTANSRYHVNNLMKLRDGYADGSADRTRAEKLLASFEAIHQLMERFRDQMRAKVNSRGI